jgi:hypothetical protein
MAISAANLSYVGQPASAAQGQIVNNGLGGPLSEQLLGIATFTGDGASTTATVNWIDGTQKIFQRPVVVVSVASVTAPATIGGVANQAVYSGVGSYGQFRVGQSVTFTGFSNAGNNGTFTINALSTSTIQVTNASSVAETAPAAAGSVNFGAVLPVALGYRSGVSAANVADTAANTITASINTITATGALVTFSAAPANAATCSVAVQLNSVV